MGGVCLKYETNRAVEVGRLMLGFQEIGQHMQNVTPTVKRKSSGGEDDLKGEPMVIDVPAKTVQEDTIQQDGQGGSQGGTAKKKKKGKR